MVAHSGADYSRTCEGCEHIIAEPWGKDALAYRCFAPGKCRGYIVGVKRFEPYIPAWCPKIGGGLRSPEEITRRSHK